MRKLMLLAFGLLFLLGCMGEPIEAKKIDGSKPSSKTTSTPVAAQNASHKNPATVQDGTQTLVTKFSAYGYPPITVQAGVPLKWVIQMDAKDLNGCNNELIIPKYNIKQKLKAGETIIEFTPDSSGVVPYSCWMGMIRSNIKVVESL